MKLKGVNAASRVIERRWSGSQSAKLSGKMNKMNAIESVECEEKLVGIWSVMNESNECNLNVKLIERQDRNVLRWFRKEEHKN